MDITPLQNINADIDNDTLKKIADTFSAACDGSCGGHTACAVTFDKNPCS